MTTLRLPLPSPALLHRGSTGRCYILAERVGLHGSRPCVAEITPGAFESIRLNPSLAWSDAWAWRALTSHKIGRKWVKFWDEHTRAETRSA